MTIRTIALDAGTFHLGYETTKPGFTGGAGFNAEWYPLHGLNLSPIFPIPIQAISIDYTVALKFTTYYENLAAHPVTLYQGYFPELTLHPQLDHYTAGTARLRAIKSTGDPLEPFLVTPTHIFENLQFTIPQYDGILDWAGTSGGTPAREYVIQSADPIIIRRGDSELATATLDALNTPGLVPLEIGGFVNAGPTGSLNVAIVGGGGSFGTGDFANAQITIRFHDTVLP